MKAAIAGAGIGGLTASLCLLRAGWRVAVLERSGGREAVGAGIQISPNGLHVLEALGLGRRIIAAGAEPEVLELRHGRSGRVVFSLPQRPLMRDRYGAPYIQILRADLCQVLREALEERAPGALRRGVEVAGLAASEDCAALRLTDGGEVAADAVIGADGVRSTLREAMLGPAPARFLGAAAWRLVVPRERLGGVEVPPGACIWAGAGRHAVTYPLRGGALVNFVGVVEQREWREEGWTLRGEAAEARRDFAGWAPLIGALIEGAEEHFRWALFDRPPARRWTEGRAALLGDACHPMPPSLAQGACQAMEDAWTLAAHLRGAASGEVPARLLAYAEARKARTARVQKASLGNLRLFHRRGPAGAAALAALSAASRIAPEALHRRFAWVYAHDVTRAHPMD